MEDEVTEAKMPTKYGFLTYQERYPDQVPPPTPEELTQRLVDPYLARTFGLVRDVTNDYLLYSLGTQDRPAWERATWTYPSETRPGLFVAKWAGMAAISILVTLAEKGAIHGELRLFIDLRPGDRQVMERVIGEVTEGRVSFSILPLARWQE